MAIITLDGSVSSVIFDTAPVTSIILKHTGNTDPGDTVWEKVVVEEGTEVSLVTLAPMIGSTLMPVFEYTEALMDTADLNVQGDMWNAVDSTTLSLSTPTMALLRSEYNATNSNSSIWNYDTPLEGYPYISDETDNSTDWYDAAFEILHFVYFEITDLFEDADTLLYYTFTDHITEAGYSPHSNLQFVDWDGVKRETLPSGDISIPWTTTKFSYEDVEGVETEISGLDTEPNKEGVYIKPGANRTFIRLPLGQSTTVSFTAVSTITNDLATTTDTTTFTSDVVLDLYLIDGLQHTRTKVGSLSINGGGTLLLPATPIAFDYVRLSVPGSNRVSVEKLTDVSKAVHILQHSAGLVHRGITPGGIPVEEMIIIQGTALPDPYDVSQIEESKINPLSDSYLSLNITHGDGLATDDAVMIKKSSASLLPHDGVSTGEAGTLGSTLGGNFLLRDTTTGERISELPYVSDIEGAATLELVPIGFTKGTFHTANIFNGAYLNE